MRQWVLLDGEAVAQTEAIMIACGQGMILFALVAVPLSCYISLRFTGDRVELFGPLVRGALWYVAGLAAAFLTGLLMELSYTASDLFLYFALRDGYIPYILALGGFFALYHRLVLRDDRAMIPVMTAFLAAYFSVAAIAEIVLDTSLRGVYQTIVMPSYRAVIPVLVPVLIGAWIREGRLPLRALYTLAILGLPAIATAAPVLLTLRYTGYGIAAGVLLPAAGVAAYLLLRGAYFPERGFLGVAVEDASMLQIDGAGLSSDELVH